MRLKRIPPGLGVRGFGQALDFYQKIWVKPESWQGGGSSSGKHRSGPSAVCVLHLLLHFFVF